MKQLNMRKLIRNDIKIIKIEDGENYKLCFTYTFLEAFLSKLSTVISLKGFGKHYKKI